MVNLFVRGSKQWFLTKMAAALNFDFCKCNFVDRQFRESAELGAERRFLTISDCGSGLIVNRASSHIMSFAGEVGVA